MKSNVPTSVSRRAFLTGSVAAAATAGLAFAGCAAPAASTSAQSSTSQDESSAASSAASFSMIRGAFAYSSTNYNPIGLNGGASTTMAATRHVFEGLYDLDLHTGEPYTALAAGDPVRLSATQYEIALRENALFSDGTPVTAADVANAIEKNCANETVGPLLDFIDAASEKDERTIVLKLKYPFDSLLQARLSLAKVFPAAQESKLNDLPIGSGPWAYIPSALNGQSVISFQPNEHYNGPLPAKVDLMTWSILKAGSSMRVTALHEHVAHAAESIPPNSIGHLQNVDVEVEFVQGFSQAFLMFNTAKRPFSDKRVRQAIFYAIDVERLIAERLDGNAAPLTSFLPKGHPNYHRASTVYAHDPEKARALLAAADVPNLSLKLLVNNNWVADLAGQIADDLKAVGITCTIEEEAIRWNEFGETSGVLPFDVMLASGDPSCFGSDPDLLMSWWYGDNIWTQGRSCWARDTSGSFETLQALLQAARETTGDEQQDLWNQCFDIIADEVPLYGLFHRQLSTGWQPDRIKGFRPLPISGLDFLGCSVVPLK